MRILAITVVFFISTMVACGEVTMNDSSLDPTYTSVIGKKFRIKEDL